MIRHTLTITTLIALLAGCSSLSTTPDEDPIKTTQAAPIGEVPEFVDLELMEGELELIELAQADQVSSFRIGTLEVIHQPTPANDVVSARLYFRGGLATANEDTQGIERLALAVAANGGTAQIPRDEFNARLDQVGSSVGFIADRDFSAMTMNTVKPYFDETWALFEAAILEPAFPDDEVERQRDRQIASIDSLRDDPDNLVNEVVRDLTYPHHPYSLRELGTRQTVEGFSIDDLKAWQRSLVNPERMVLVVVGNISRDELVAKLRPNLGRISSRPFAATSAPSVSHQKPGLKVNSMELPTNYILGYFSAPAMDHVDYPALLLATRHLRSRLFEEVRTRRNLTYAVSAGLGNRAANVGFLYVTAVDPAATMPVIFTEVERLKSTLLSQQELEEVRNVFLTSHFMGMETNSSIASQLASAALLAGDWTQSTRFLDAINAVTPDDIQRVTDQYLTNIQFGVGGNPDDVPPALFGVSTDDGSAGEHE